MCFFHFISKPAVGNITKVLIDEEDVALKISENLFAKYSGCERFISHSQLLVMKSRTEGKCDAFFKRFLRNILKNQYGNPQITVCCAYCFQVIPVGGKLPLVLYFVRVLRPRAVNKTLKV